MKMTRDGFILLVFFTLITTFSSISVAQQQSSVVEVLSLNRNSFPKDFVFGTASAAYQYEGAANEGGRKPSIWDAYTHKYPERINNGSNGDVAVDQYHRYKEDIQIMKNMNLDAYRFSISWSRVLPSLTPYVTLFHWDLPQALEEEYGEYSKGIIGITLNSNWVEPYSNSQIDKEASERALDFSLGCCSQRIPIGPQFGPSWLFVYPKGIRKLLLYTEYKVQQSFDLHNEKMVDLSSSISLNGLGVYIIKMTHDGFILLVFFTLITTFSSISVAQQQSSVVEVLSLNRNSFPKDFVFGTASAAYQYEGAANEGGRKPSIWDAYTHKYPDRINNGSNGDVAVDQYHRYKEDIQIMKNMNLDAYRFSISWSRVLPSLTPYVTLFHWDLPQAPEDEYGGMGDISVDPTLSVKEMLQDTYRIDYHYRHLYYLLSAIGDGVRVKGYFAWSLLDNFEWKDGYNVRFGLNFVDYKNGLKRHAKQSQNGSKLFFKRIRLMEV
ncbi:hypothetical protein ACSQ67_011004 [Phaseolus vulgaris]